MQTTFTCTQINKMKRAELVKILNEKDIFATSSFDSGRVLTEVDFLTVKELRLLAKKQYVPNKKAVINKTVSTTDTCSTKDPIPIVETKTPEEIREEIDAILNNALSKTTETISTVETKTPEEIREEIDTILNNALDKATETISTTTTKTIEKKEVNKKICKKQLYPNSPQKKKPCTHECYKYGMCKTHWSAWRKANPWLKYPGAY